MVITDDGPVVVGELGPNGAEVIDARTGEVPIRISDGLDSAGLTFGRTSLGVVSYDSRPTPPSCRSPSG